MSGPTGLGSPERHPRSLVRLLEGEHRLGLDWPEPRLELDLPVGLDRNEPRRRLPAPPEHLLTKPKRRSSPCGPVRCLHDGLDARVDLRRVLFEGEDEAKHILHRPRDRHRGLDLGHGMPLSLAGGLSYVEPYRGPSARALLEATAGDAFTDGCRLPALLRQPEPATPRRQEERLRFVLSSAIVALLGGRRTRLNCRVASGPSQTVSPETPSSATQPRRVGGAGRPTSRRGWCEDEDVDPGSKEV